MTPYLAAEDLSMFGHDPWWLVVVKAVFCFAFLMVTVLFSIVWEPDGSSYGVCCYRGVPWRRCRS